MIFGMLGTAVPVFAEEPQTCTYTVRADKNEANPGDTINFTVYMQQTGILHSVEFELSIPSGLTFKAGSSFVPAGTQSAIKFDTISLEESTMIFNGVGSNPSPFNGGEEIALLQFSCSVDNSAVGDYTVTLNGAKAGAIDFQTFAPIVKTVAPPIPATVTVTPAPVPVTNVTLNKSTMTLSFGSSETLTATVLPDNATDKTVTWSSNDSTVASVDSNGKVTAKKVGTATITATAGGKSATCVVTVSKANPVVDAPTGLTATYGETLADVTLPAGWAWKAPATSVGNVGSHSFAAVYTPADTNNYNTVEKSVTVTVGKATPTVTPPTVNTGLVYNGNPQALVTAGSTTDGTMYYAIGATQPTDGWNTEVPTGTDARAYTVWYKVVGDNNHKDVNPTPINVTIAPKAVAKPTADTTVYTYTGSELTYNVVANDGYTVTGNKQTNAGTYEVKVTLKANYVWADDSTTPVTFQFVINKASISDGDITAPTAKTLNFNGNNQILVNAGSADGGVMWYALGTDTTSVPADDKWSTNIPSGKDEGNYYVWYKVVGDNNHVCTVAPACVTVTIGPEISSNVAVTGVALDKDTMTLTVGGTDTLTAIVTPDNATNKAVIWSTSDSTVATVNNGVVTAVGVGTAIITVTTEDGLFTDTCTVTVNAAGGSGGGSGSGGGGHYWHYDYNGDGKCDYCGSATNCKHTDANKDGKCDICYACIKHVDKNNDGFCDLCKNKIVESGKTFDAGVVLYAGMAALAATGSAVVIGKKRKSK